MKNLKSNKFYLLVMVALILFMSSCAGVTPIEECVVEAAHGPYGFWSGLWHGIISPISFIGSLFFDHIAVYGVNNTGGWYDFGFLLGAGVLLRGGSNAKSK